MCVCVSVRVCMYKSSRVEGVSSVGICRSSCPGRIPQMCCVSGMQCVAVPTEAGLRVTPVLSPVASELGLDPLWELLDAPRRELVDSLMGSGT